MTSTCESVWPTPRGTVRELHPETGQPSFGENSSQDDVPGAREYMVDALAKAARRYGENPVNLARRQYAIFIGENFSLLDSRLGLEHSPPAVSQSPEGEFLLEWWGPRGRKLSIYVDSDSAEAIKVWGADPEGEMMTVQLEGAELVSLWRWIRDI